MKLKIKLLVSISTRELKNFQPFSLLFLTASHIEIDNRNIKAELASVQRIHYQYISKDALSATFPRNYNKLATMLNENAKTNFFLIYLMQIIF